MLAPFSVMDQQRRNYVEARTQMDKVKVSPSTVVRWYNSINVADGLTFEALYQQVVHTPSLLATTPSKFTKPYRPQQFPASSPNAKRPRVQPNSMIAIPRVGDTTPSRTSREFQPMQPPSQFTVLPPSPFMMTPPSPFIPSRNAEQQQQQSPPPEEQFIDLGSLGTQDPYDNPNYFL